jgi:outer membrane lipoprotein-sorting protein
MKNRMFRYYGIGLLLLPGWTLVAMGQPAGKNFESSSTSYSIATAPLTVQQVVKRLQEKNAERAAALDSYTVTRVYSMRYSGFPSDRNAEMVINMTYRAPNSKQFSVVSQSGSKFIIDHIFKKLLEGEQEAANEENRRQSALTTENYDFTLAGYETSVDGGRYILNLAPRTKNKFLYRGKIWVDAKDFAVRRIEGEPEKNPSFWIKKTDVEHSYVKVGDFWLPAENRTESVIRLGGIANLSITYKDYRSLETTSLPTAKTVQKR